MPQRRKDLFIALGVIAGGVVAFFAFLALTGGDPDGRTLAWYEWAVAGALIGPGFGLLLRWSQARQ